MSENRNQIKCVHRSFAIIAVFVLVLMSISFASDVTFQVSGNSGIFWNLDWVAQSLDYSSEGVYGVTVDKIDIIFKDGMDENAVEIEFYKNYDYAGHFSGLIYSENFTVTQNLPETYTFSTPVKLRGDSDGVFFMKLSPAKGGFMHSFFDWNDTGSDPLRHGTVGKLFASNSPAGVDSPQFRYDLGEIKVYTNASSLTFSNYYPDNLTTYWNQPWATQSLYYVDGAVIDKVEMVLKGGMTNDKVLFEFFRGNYVGSGQGDTLIYSEVLDVIPETWGTYDFSSDVVLSGDSDDVYYMKVSPAEGGFVHAFAVWADSEGGDPLRHGSNGVLFVSGQEPVGTGDWDYDGLRVYTYPNIVDCEAAIAYGLTRESDIFVDCNVDLLDFTLLANNWMQCNDPLESNCD